MKKVPRNLSGEQFIKLLAKLGYSKNRQVGSHARLITDKNGKHSITIPIHDPLKIGTLSKIINDVAIHHKMTKEEVIEYLF